MPALIEEPLLIVLAVDLDEPSGKLGQPGRRHALVVDAGRRSAGRGDLADADERLRQPVEQRLHPGRVGPVAHQRGVGPGADRQTQRVDQQALAGTGLAREHVQARLEDDSQTLDQRQVANAQLGQAACGDRRGGGLGLRRHRYRGLDLRRLGHEGSSSDFWRSRSQNGSAPLGSMKWIGLPISQTDTTSPIARRRSSRPSTLIRTSWASTIRIRTV